MDFVVVKDIAQGIERTKEFLYDEVDRKTVLFLSGGKTPKALYETLAKEQILTPAAVGMIDERFGPPMHANSNELMVQDSGFLGYLEKQNIPFYSMLENGNTYQGVARLGDPQKIPASDSLNEDISGGKERQDPKVLQVVNNYDQTVRDLFFKFPKSIAVVGIGDDGHIASIFPNRKDFTNPLYVNNNTYEYVVGVDDPGKYGKRISLTFAGLSLIDFYIVFVFGKEKKRALKKALQPGSLEEIPARFFQQPEISAKTLFITDQKL